MDRTASGQALLFLAAALISGCDTGTGTPSSEGVGNPPGRTSSAASVQPGTEPSSTPDATLAFPESAAGVAIDQQGCLSDGCHAELQQTRWVHGPVAVSACQVCHQPDGPSADHRFRFTRPREDLCAFCHPPLAVKASRHAPYVESQCLQCHRPHGGRTNSYLIADNLVDLCGRCHEQQTTHASHKPVQEGNCLACHAAHESEHEHLLRHSENELCFNCHREYVGLLDGVDYVHAPVREACGSCHLSHGGTHVALLRAPYPGGPYAEFSEAAYELCFTCHDVRQISEERTTRTGFRDGDRNLHFVHVVRKKGRECGVCHQPHAARNPKLIRESFTFGRWEMPINFKKSESGGSCGSGCHQALSYNNAAPRSLRKGGSEEEAR